MPATPTDPDDSHLGESAIALGLPAFSASPDVAPVVPVTVQIDAVDEEPKSGVARLLTLTPAWLVSMLAHVMLLLLLGLVTLADPQKIINVLSSSISSDEGPEIEEFTIDSIELDEPTETEDFTEPAVDVSEPVAPIQEISMEVPMDVAAVPLEMSSIVSPLAPAASKLQTLTSTSEAQLSGRGKDMKAKLLLKYGGTKSSEAAVQEALKWLALHQAPNGGWTFNHSAICRNRCRDIGDRKYINCVNAATALALLPFLGAGQTHYEGEFQNVVRQGLLFLIKNGKTGTRGGVKMMEFTEPAGRMYSHGLVTIALSEAYAMTGDPALQVPTQQALNFIAFAQGRDGGWRYQPQAQRGDTSVVGWQLMALKSGYMGHLTVSPKVIMKSTKFLDRVSALDGAIYGYDSPPRFKMDGSRELNVRPACTAIGLLCRMYTGWDKNHPGIKRGVDELAKIGVRKNNMYYNYYAAQVLRHAGGDAWDSFNTELRDHLVAVQSQKPGEKGSWHFADASGHSGPLEGGRLLSTSFATMILEVYYRHMPLYAESAAEDDFPL